MNVGRDLNGRMPRPKDDRSADELADSIAKSYLEFVKQIKATGSIEVLSVMELIKATDNLIEMKKELSKLLKNLQEKLRIKVIENEQTKDNSDYRKAIKINTKN